MVSGGEEDVPVKIVESVTIRGILIIVQLWKDVLSPDRDICSRWPCLSREERHQVTSRYHFSLNHSLRSSSWFGGLWQELSSRLLYLLHHLNPIRVPFLLQFSAPTVPLFISLQDVLGPSSITQQRSLCHDPAGFPRAHLDRRNQDSPCCSWPRGREKALTQFVPSVGMP